MSGDGRALVRFGAVSLALIAGTAGLLGLAFRGGGDGRAIWTSAVVAFVVQLAVFAAVRRMARSNVIAGWGLGALLRFVVFGVYAVLGVKVLALPLTAALVSLATFFFLSTLVEPLWLNS